jgi:hypothetical protein
MRSPERGGNSKVPFFAFLGIFEVKELPFPGLSASKRQAVTGRHEQTHCIGNASETGFESYSEKPTLFHSLVWGVQMASDLAAIT